MQRVTYGEKKIGSAFEQSKTQNTSLVDLNEKVKSLLNVNQDSIRSRV